MAGNTCSECGKRIGQDRKVADLVRAAEHAATKGDDDTDLRLEVLTEWLAGRCGPERQMETWARLRQEAQELTGVNYGHPSTGSQTAVIGTLYGIVCSRAYYAENPDKVFAGLSVGS